MSGGSEARWRRLAREPFIHFLVLGALLFAGHALWQRAQDYEANTIVVDPEEMERRAILFAGENKRSPTDEELQALLYDFVQEEALVREAGRLGLAEGDTIVRRRLAQKARFMIEDTVDLPTPDRDTLCQYLEDNPDRFAEPAQRSFAHIFVAPDGRSDAELRDIAARLLAQANNENWESLGDPFLLNRSYRLASFPDVTKAFGPDFARGLFELEVGEDGFQGPISSAFGLHLVRIDGESERVVPECASIESELEQAWRNDQRERANAEKIREIIDQYEIVVTE